MGFPVASAYYKNSLICRATSRSKDLIFICPVTNHHFVRNTDYIE